MQYKAAGKGSPVVLVPGGLTGWISWEPHAKILSEKHTVIRVQLLNVQLGFEDRDLPGDYSIKTESGALAAALQTTGYDKFDIAGWSYGAFTSLQFALDNPEKVKTLTLIEPPAFWVLRSDGKFDERTQKEADFLSGLQGNITEDMLEQFLVHAGFVKPGESPRTLPQWERWLPYKRSLRNSPAVVNYRDDKERLKKFNRPVLLVKGTGSSFWLHNIIDELGRNLPDSRTIELPEGHGPHLVSMKEFLTELERFTDHKKTTGV